MKALTKRTALLTALIIMLSVMLAACEPADSSGATTDSATNEDVFVIKTTYCDLKYPAKWEKKIKVDSSEGSDGKVSFLMNDTSVFDITFGDGETLLGVLEKDSKSTDIYVKFYELDEKDKDYDSYAAMQDDVNVITANLEKDYNFKIGTPLLEDDGKTFEVKTSVATLYYPLRWKDTVTINTDENKTEFLCDGTKLFCIYFGGDKGELLGTYNGSELRLETYEFDEEKLSQEQLFTYSAMQEDFNTIFEKLCEDKNFDLALPNQ